MKSSFLYVPADKPNLFDKAISSGADAVIFDLEDAVAPDQKDKARGLISGYLSSLEPDALASAPQIWVRINAIDGNDQLDADVESCAFPSLSGVALAKCETVEQLERLSGALGRICNDREAPMPQISALIESPMGVMNLRELCASGLCRRLQIGEADLASSLGLDPQSVDAFLFIRTSVIVASAAFELEPPIGPVYVDFKDVEGFRKSSIYLKSLGFSGRSCIHPSQVPIVNEVFHPSEKELVDAQELVDLFESHKEAGSGVFTGSDGKMVDIAVVRAAYRLLGG